jgi:hypothetical protein
MLVVSVCVLARGVQVVPRGPAHVCIYLYWPRVCMYICIYAVHRVEPYCCGVYYGRHCRQFRSSVSIAKASKLVYIIAGIVGSFFFIEVA